MTLLLTLAAGAAESAAPLVLERTIALPDVAGRINHMSIDPARNHLFVAELGTVDAIDLETGKSVGRIVVTVHLTAFCSRPA